MQKVVRFLFLLGLVGFFAYCNSSTNKVASSFSKRKYTKGHFSDPVAKLKMDYAPYGSIAVLPDLKQTPNTEAKNLVFPKTAENAQTEPGFNKKIGIAKSPAASNNNSVSLKENLVSMPYQPYSGHNMPEKGSDGSGYLLAWIICLGVSIICLLLLIGWATSMSAGSELGVGCALYIIGGFAFIAAIVLFILWIIAISRS